MISVTLTKAFAIVSTIGAKAVTKLDTAPMISATALPIEDTNTPN